MKKIEAREGMRIHFLYIAGTWMIELGINGFLSRGSLGEGVMKDQSLLGSVPSICWHLREPRITLCCNGFRTGWGYPKAKDHCDQRVGWWKGRALQSKETIWVCSRCQRRVCNCLTCLWAPPPAATDFAIEELQRSRHKWPHLFHVFICLQLMTPHWR